MKTQQNSPTPLHCLDHIPALCAWACEPKSEVMRCFSGGGTCQPARLLVGATSKFHDRTLINATKKINRILASIPADPEGRRPALLVTNKGIFLAWVQPSKKKSGKRLVTAESDDATVIEALKLKV